MRNERVKIVFGFVIISLIWGTTWLAIKVGLVSISPLFGITLRFIVAACVLSVLLMLRKESLPLDTMSIVQYLNLALLSFSIPFMLVYWGEQFIASGMAAVIFAMYPFVVALGSYLILTSERLTKVTIAGMALGFFGVVLIFWNDVNIAVQNTVGMGAILASTILQGISLVLVKKANHPVNPIALTLGGILLSIPIVLPLAFFLEDFKMIQFTFEGIASVCYLGTLGSVVTFVIYYWLLERVETVYLSLVSFVTPVIAVAVGVIYLHESLSSGFVAGAFFVLIGIVVANGKDLLGALRVKKENISK